MRPPYKRCERHQSAPWVRIPPCPPICYHAEAVAYLIRANGVEFDLYDYALPQEYARWLHLHRKEQLTPEEKAEKKRIELNAAKRFWRE